MKVVGVVSGSYYKSALCGHCECSAAAAVIQITTVHSAFAVPPRGIVVYYVNVKGCQGDFLKKMVMKNV